MRIRAIAVATALAVLPLAACGGHGATDATPSHAVACSSLLGGKAGAWVPTLKGPGCVGASGVTERATTGLVCGSTGVVLYTVDGYYGRTDGPLQQTPKVATPLDDPAYARTYVACNSAS